MLRPPGHALLDGARRTLYGKPFVAAPGVNTNGVNGSAPGFISGPIHTLLMVHLSRSEERRAFERSLMSDPNPLKTSSFLSLTKCPLNRI